MKKLMLLLVSAAAISFAANAVVIGYGANTDADEWFDGGIEAGWPETAVGGGWSNTNGTTYADQKLNVSALAETPLTFTADVAKVTADYKATISSTVGFTAFDTLPDVPKEAKAGVIVYKGNFYALADNGSGNAWADTGIEATDAAEISISFLDSTNVVYAIGENAPVTNRIAEATEIRNVCMSGDGSIANLKATTEVKVFDPTQQEEIPCKTEAEAEQKAARINDNLQTVIKAPDALSDKDKAGYRDMFHATAEGTVVTIGLSDDAEDAVQKNVNTNTVTESVAAALIEPESTSVTIDAHFPGLYYWIEGAEAVDFGTMAQGDAAMATSKGSLLLVKPDKVGTGAQQFYKVAAGVKDPAPKK